MYFSIVFVYMTASV